MKGSFKVQQAHISLRSYTLTVISYYWPYKLLAKEIYFPADDQSTNFLLDVDSPCQSILLPVMLISTSNVFCSPFLQFHWRSVFYSCFMPVLVKTNEQKLMNVHVQIKCYIIFFSFSLPNLPIKVSLVLFQI